MTLNIVIIFQLSDERWGEKTLRPCLLSSFTLGLHRTFSFFCNLYFKKPFFNGAVYNLWLSEHLDNLIIQNSVFIPVWCIFISFLNLSSGLTSTQCMLTKIIHAGRNHVYYEVYWQASIAQVKLYYCLWLVLSICFEP